MDTQSFGQQRDNDDVDHPQIKEEPQSPEYTETRDDTPVARVLNSADKFSSARSPPAEPDPPSLPVAAQPFRLVPVIEQRSPSPDYSSDPDRSFSISPEPEQPFLPRFALHPSNVGLQLSETPDTSITPDALPPETPARLIAPSPLPVVVSSPRPTSESMRALQNSQNQIVVKTEESPAETLRASDNTPTGSDSSTSTQSGFGDSTSTTVPSTYNLQSAPTITHLGTPSTRRTTRGSLAAAASTSGDMNQVMKRATPEPGDPIQASVTCWIVTKLKDWVLPPPKMGVSLAQLVPPDAATHPWMKFTRHPILWDQKTDAGGKSGKKLVIIGAAAIKKSVNGKLPESSSQKDETFDGLHLLMDFDPDQRPTYSYALMTRFAILGSPYKSLSLGEIYMMLEAKFPYFAKDESKWRDSIRYNLSSNNWFIKTKRALHQPGIGNLWRVDEESLGGAKRPRKGRNRGSAFTDPDDNGDDGSQDENGEIASTSTRNGTLMLTFDSKQKVPLDKDAGERGATGHANHNMMSRVASRQAGSSSTKPQDEEYSLSTIDPYAEARDSAFIGAAKAAIERTRETAELQKRAPKNTPAPPWMSSAELEAEDSGIGSGKDDDSEVRGRDGDESDNEEGAPRENRVNTDTADDIVHMDEDTSSPPSPNSASSPPATTQQAYNLAADRHMFSPPSPPPSRPVTVRTRPSGAFPEFGKVVSVPTFASIWGQIGSGNGSSSALQRASARPTHVPSSSSTSTAASADTNRQSSPEPTALGVSALGGRNQRGDLPSFKTIAPPKPTGGLGGRAAIATHILTPYEYLQDSRKRKKAQTSPGRGALSPDERKQKLRKIETTSAGREAPQAGVHPIFPTASQSSMGTSSFSAQRGRMPATVGMPPPNPAVASESTPSLAPASASASRTKRPPEITRSAAVLSTSMRSMYPSAMLPAGFGGGAKSTEDGRNGSSRQARSFSGPSSSVARGLATQRNSIAFEGFGAQESVSLASRWPTSSGGQSRSRRRSGNMDIDQDLMGDGHDSDPYERHSSPEGRLRMDLDGSEDESWRERVRRPEQNLSPWQMDSYRDTGLSSRSVFAQATIRSGSSLSVSVPVSSSRTERGPPTPREGVAPSPRSASQSPILANLVSPTGPPTPSSRLPPITSLLGPHNLPSELHEHLAPIQNAPSRETTTVTRLHPAGQPSSQPGTPTSPRRIELSNRSSAASQPSTFGPPLYYGFIISETPPVPVLSRSSSAYYGGDGDDIAYPRYSTRDWRD